MKRYFFFILLILIFGCASSLPDYTALLSQRNPIDGPAQAIGEYSLGCLSGAQTFKGNEKGLILSQTRRGRFWGHPDLIKLITDAGIYFHKHKKQMIVGDMSMSRGGPTITGHNSHQTGLDVDIWFKIPKTNEQMEFHALQTEEMKSMEALGEDQLNLVRYFTRLDRVERIFINPKMKRAICLDPKKNDFKTEELRKLRAWWGHDDHIHVRLSCPADSPLCVSQKPVDQGDGCDQLDWWFTDEAKEDGEYNFESMKKTYLDKVEKLPAACSFYKEVRP